MKSKKKVFFITNYNRRDILHLLSKYRSILPYYINCNNKKSVNKLNNFFSKKRDDTYIISFSNSYIFKKKIIKNVNKQKFFNFHPAIPKYRGRDVSHFACYFKEKYFGGTLHLINEKIDNGEIIDVKKYKIKKNSTHYDYTKIGHKAIKFLLKKNLNDLINGRFEITKIKWGKKLYTRKLFLKQMKVERSFSKRKLNHIISSFYTKEFKSLYFKNKNKKKYLILN